MTRQLPLAVGLRPGSTLENFIAGENRQLLALLQTMARSAISAPLFINGPSGSGKTHLLMGLCSLAEEQARSSIYMPLDDMQHLSPDLLDGLEDMDIIAIDGIQHIAGSAAWEEALFVLFNNAREQQRNLVFTADQGPARLPLALPDLGSRLAWGNTYRLHPLDDSGLMELVQLQAQKRALQLKPKVARWLITHCKRSPAALLDLLDKLDQLALAEKRHNLSLPFIQSSLKQLSCD